jgi:hypothetical protein
MSILKFVCKCHMLFATSHVIGLFKTAVLAEFEAHITEI